MNVRSLIRWPLDAKPLLPKFRYIQNMPGIRLHYCWYARFYHKTYKLGDFLTSRLNELMTCETQLICALLSRINRARSNY